jgi:hypothetical protein
MFSILLLSFESSWKRFLYFYWHIAQFFIHDFNGISTVLNPLLHWQKAQFLLHDFIDTLHHFCSTIFGIMHSFMSLRICITAFLYHYDIDFIYMHFISPWIVFSTFSYIVSMVANLRFHDSCFHGCCICVFCVDCIWLATLLLIDNKLVLRIAISLATILS